MNTSQLRSYAPESRKRFIAAARAQAARLGVTASGISEAQVRGDVLLVGGQAFPRAIASARGSLVSRVQAHGFDATMESIAYTWFNRLVAIRYMEIHGYLDHGYRVLSHPGGEGRPEILDHAADVDLAGLDRSKAVELKLDGTKDEELYRLLLLAQCNALHEAMPFLFEKIGDETELLLPGNLLHTDSLIRQLVEQVDEALWQEIEIIGWLYQFYISEKKDQVIGKVVKSEDIPAATQLFTPNWIVKYLVQNSLGAQWLATYPQSPLKGQMEYYIEPAEQTAEVKAQLAAITPRQLNPEEVTLIDPASGSGHILVEAYDLFKAIYLERGYRQRDVPQLILEKNLFGLEICPRAAQLTGFALMMKGRADDRRLFERRVKLNVLALVDSAEFDAEGLAKGVRSADYGLQPTDLTELKQLFEHATTFGSLIQLPVGLAAKLPALERLSKASSQDLFVSEALKRLAPLVQQAELLAAQYSAVVANPPYLGGKLFCDELRGFVSDLYRVGKADLYGAFVLRNMTFAGGWGRVGMITIPNWLSISSFEGFRKAILRDMPIASLVDNGRGVWGSDFGSCAFVLQRAPSKDVTGRYLRLFDKPGSVAGNDELERRFFANPRFSKSSAEFEKIPGSPIAYWLGKKATGLFVTEQPIGERLDATVGLQTCDNSRFLRFWTEVSHHGIGFDVGSAVKSVEIGRKWFPYNKGGGFRKWYGNNEFVVNWWSDGHDIKTSIAEDPRKRVGGRINGAEFYFREAVSWSDITISRISFRFVPQGSIFDVTGNSAFAEDTRALFTHLAYLNTEFVNRVSKVLNPTVHFPAGYFRLLPSASCHPERFAQAAEKAVKLSRDDWDTYERSWDFQSLPLLAASSDSPPTLESSYSAWITRNRDTFAEMKGLEVENNRLFIDAYRLQDELTPDVPIEQITLTVNPAYRYGGKLTEEEQWTRFRQDTMQELVSYAIGCMMGRYSLDEPGLIYAHSGNEGFDPSRYKTFPADDDGIIPLTDTDWFDDDATHRLVEFIVGGLGKSTSKRT